MTRAAEVAAALKRIAAWKRGVDWDLLSTGQMIDDLEALLQTLRESQPEPAPVVGDDDAALLAKTQDWLSHNLTVTPDSHYRNVQALLERCSVALADVARLKEERDAARQEFYNYQRSGPITSANQERDRFRDELTQARAALAAAVAEGDQFCRTLVDLYDAADETGQPWRRISVSNALIDGLRARAGRNDG